MGAYQKKHIVFPDREKVLAAHFEQELARDAEYVPSGLQTVHATAQPRLRNSLERTTHTYQREHAASPASANVPVSQSTQPSRTEFGTEPHAHTPLHDRRRQDTQRQYLYERSAGPRRPARTRQ